MDTEVSEGVVGTPPTPATPVGAPLSPTSTSCRGCTFAAWDGNCQTGCHLGRLEKFREKDPSCVLEVYDDLPDGGGEVNFFVINGRICRGFRPSQWVREGESLEEQANRVRREIELRLALIVPLLNSKGEPAQRKTELAHFCCSVKAMTKKPHQVIFVNKQKYLSPQELHAFLWDNLESEVTWKVVQVFEDTSQYEQGGARLEGRLIDIGVEKMDRQVNHYAVFYPRHRVPPGFAQDLDRAANEGQERFSLLTPDRKGAGLVVQRGVHDHPSIGGNALIALSCEEDGPVESILWRLEDKVKKMAEGDPEAQSLIRPVWELCQGMARS